MVELESPKILDEPEMFWEAKILLDLNKKTRNNQNSYPFASELARRMNLQFFA